MAWPRRFCGINSPPKWPVLGKQDSHWLSTAEVNLEKSDLEGVCRPQCCSERGFLPPSVICVVLFRKGISWPAEFRCVAERSPRRDGNSAQQPFPLSPPTMSKNVCLLVEELGRWRKALTLEASTKTWVWSPRTHGKRQEQVPELESQLVWPSRRSSWPLWNFASNNYTYYTHETLGERTEFLFQNMK